MSYILFAIPRFIFGLAKALDLGATFDQYNVNKTPSDADWKAIASDWNAVGNDIKYALSQESSANQ